MLGSRLLLVAGDIWHLRLIFEPDNSGYGFDRAGQNIDGI